MEERYCYVFHKKIKMAGLWSHPREFKFKFETTSSSFSFSRKYIFFLFLFFSPTYAWHVKSIKTNSLTFSFIQIYDDNFITGSRDPLTIRTLYK